MRASTFDELVEKAFRRIPLRFRKRMQNVSIVIEKEPSSETSDVRTRAGRHDAARAISGPTASDAKRFRSRSRMPDRITLFQGPIERASHGPADVPRVIADTLWHEIAHYFGMDERQVRAAERRRASAVSTSR